MRPDWNQLYELAAAQDGLFSTEQASAAGYSSQLLRHHVHHGRIVRTLRGIYRLVHFPAGEHEDLVVAWLWSHQAGVVSHSTALALHRLSGVLPYQVDLTVPGSWRGRRLQVPPGITLHYADVPAPERTWHGPVPVTQPRRTLEDCALANLPPELLQQAAAQALQRGLVTRAEIPAVWQALAPYGALAA